MCNGQGLVGGFVSADSGYDAETCPTCNGSGSDLDSAQLDSRWYVTRPPGEYRIICRNNQLSINEDVYKGRWVSTTKEAMQCFKAGPNYWMRWSFALLIERRGGHRMWVHSLPPEEHFDYDTRRA